MDALQTIVTLISDISVRGTWKLEVLATKIAAWFSTTGLRYVNFDYHSEIKKLKQIPIEDLWKHQVKTTPKKVDLPPLWANPPKPDGKSSQTWVRPAQVCASFQRPPWNIMLQNTIYLIENDTDSAIRGFQQVCQPGALSFCIKRTQGVLEHGGCSPKEAAEEEASPLILRESAASVAAGSPAPAQMTEMPELRPSLLLVHRWTLFCCFCDTTARLSSD